VIGIVSFAGLSSATSEHACRETSKAPAITKRSNGGLLLELATCITRLIFANRRGMEADKWQWKVSIPD
jgi:hypothetical protein